MTRALSWEADGKTLDRFLEVWRELTYGDPEYRRPGGEAPRALSHVRRMLCAAYPMRTLRLFVAYDDACAPGACAVLVEDVTAADALFCLYAARRSEDSVAALIEAMVTHLRARGGAERLLGPVSPSPLAYGAGLMLSGPDAPPMPLCPYNPPCLAEYLERTGFSQSRAWGCYRMASADVDGERLARLAARAQRGGVMLRGVKRADAATRRDMRSVLARAGMNDAGDAALRLALDELSHYARPGLTQIAYADGEAVGMVMAVLDGGVCFPMLQAVVPEARGGGALAALHWALYEQIRRMGIGTIEMGLVDEENRASARVLLHIGAKPARRYALYGMTL